MKTEEISDRFVTPCFVNGLEAYDGEINLGVEENMISNEFAVKLCLVHEVKRGNKVVKKELIMALSGEIYFVKFIINLEEDDVKPEYKEGSLNVKSLKAEPIRLLSNVLCQVGVTRIIAKFLILDMLIDRDTPLLVGRGFLHIYGGIVKTIDNITSTFDGICHQTFHAAKTSLDTAESDTDDEEDYAFQRNKYGAPIYGPKPARLWEEKMMKPDHQEPNILDNMKPWKRLGLYHAEELDEEGFDVYFKGGVIKTQQGVGTQRERERERESLICCGWFITKLARKGWVLSDEVLRSLSSMIYYRDLDTTTLRELIDSKGRLILEDPQIDVHRVAIPRAQRASM
uniref:Uncharacterized protein n=1 Tax=Tanacetum cinerariifolium TaxID=118510 RepID=A0A6L2KE53_TANCI|nr:hypothetical protein [Tanacetum cinerariifolium]